MQRRRTLPARNQVSLSETLSRHALLAGGASSLRQSNTSITTEVDPDLAALKASWSWNFAGAPRTSEQEDKQWFQPQSKMRTTQRSSCISCSRCGQTLRFQELISHQAECIGEREVSSDEEFTGMRARWKGPLDKDKPKASRLPKLEDFLADLDFDDDFDDDFDFSHLGAGARGSYFGGTRSSGGLPRQYGGWSSATSKQSGRASASSSHPTHSRSSSSAAPPPQRPQKPQSPPQRPTPPQVRSTVAAAPSSMALDSALAVHESSWTRFDASKASGISYADVPWPDHSKAASDTLLVQHALCKAAEAGEVKAALRKLQLRWHPDKWSQRFASRLSPGDADRVLTRVKEIAQIVNGLKAST